MVQALLTSQILHDLVSALEVVSLSTCFTSNVQSLPAVGQCQTVDVDICRLGPLNGPSSPYWFWPMWLPIQSMAALLLLPCVLSRRELRQQFQQYYGKHEYWTHVEETT